MRIQEVALLASLTIKKWTGRKQDKKATKEVIDRHGATSDAGRFNKQLISAAEIKKITSISNEARAFHYRITMPWNDHGERVLPAKLHVEYKTGLEDLRAKFVQQVEDFLRRYEMLKQQARFELGSLYRESDYPNGALLERRFYFDVRFAAVPDSGDFRVHLRTEDLARIRADIENRTAAALRGTQLDLLERLYKVVDHMAERLQDPDARFHKTLVTNLDDVCELIPKLNFTGDPDIRRAADRVRDLLSGLDAEQLREAVDHRAETAKVARNEAARIHRLMGSYTGRLNLSEAA